MAVASGLLERAVQVAIKCDAEAAEVEVVATSVAGVVVSAGTAMLTMADVAATIGRSAL